MELAIKLGAAKEVGLIVRGTPIRYDVKSKQLNCSGTSALVELSEGNFVITDSRRSVDD